MSPTKLDELISKQEILECIMKYSRGVDRFDRELMLSTFHPDAIDDHGEELTPEAFVDYAMRRDKSRSRIHHIGNVLIELYGDQALAETYWLAYQAWNEGGTHYLRSRFGRYADRFERREGVWKVAHRRVIDDWSKVEQYDSAAEGLSKHRGSHFPEDPVYVLQREIAAIQAQRKE